MHEELLAEVESDWTASGVLPELLGLLRDVWRTNLERHEPALGDDAVTLGMGSARNFANRTVQVLVPRNDVIADLQGNSLRVIHLGRTLRASKLPGKSVHTDPYSIDWDSSATRHQGPLANSQQLELFELPTEELAANSAVGSPRYLHLAWAGDAETGDVAVHLGFPRDTRDGAEPWFAVRMVYCDQPGDQLPIVPVSESGGDRFDQRPVPPIAVRLRAADRVERQVAGNDGA
ncbi:hypothetical protein [Kribbella catacumbae]|uniref:hypothetical protein n=1 Tax=Kribbella catacumbae TaxID=460086 RepID=UPI00036F083C|nr:hypothetical protein [Kribbella catacumbae]